MAINDAARADLVAEIKGRVLAVFGEFRDAHTEDATFTGEDQLRAAVCDLLAEEHDDPGLDEDNDLIDVTLIELARNALGAALDDVRDFHIRVRERAAR